MPKFEEMPKAEVDLANILNQISALDESKDDFEEKKQKLLRQAATFNTNEHVEIIKENSEDEQIEESDIDRKTLEELIESVENSALSPEAKNNLVSDLNKKLSTK